MGLFKRKTNYLVRLMPLDRTIEVGRKQTLLQAALEAQIPFPHDCRVGTCGTCKCRLVGGNVRPLLDYSYVLSLSDLRQGYILACQTLVRSDLEIQLDRIDHQPAHAIQKVEGVIQELRPLTHDILEVTVELQKKLMYTAGQYADFKVPELDLVRSYSFVDPPEPGGSTVVRFYVRRVPGGCMSGWIHEQARPGMSVSLEGPYGSFWLRPSDRPILCIAGGSGLAPVKSMLEQAAREQCHRRVVLLFGARTQRDLYALSEIDGIRSSWRGTFTFVPVLSEEPADTNWQGERGFVTEFIHPDLEPELTNCDAYMCGPPPMIDAAIRRLNELGVPNHRIYFDKF